MKELLTRSISGSVYVGLLVISIYYADWAFFVLIAVFSSLALWEFVRLLRWPVLPFLLLLLSCFYSFYKGGGTAALMPQLLAGTLFANLWVCIRCFTNYQGHLGWLEKGSLVLFYLIGSSTFIAVLHTVNYDSKPLYILWLYMGIWINNSFAYLVGSQFGKTKLYPAISPKKSHEGYWGGALACLSFIYFIHYQYEAFGSLWWLVGLGIPFWATAGDFVQSYFKRRAKVKDSGHWLPGHGGFYDRMDSIIFTAPFYYLLLKFI